MDGPLQTLRLEMPVPSRLAGDDWRDARGQCQKAALELWRRYAKNVVESPLSHSRVVTPHDLQRSLPSFRHGAFLGGKCTADRMGYGGNRSACGPYRSEIADLYMGGASTHSGELIHFVVGLPASV